MPREHTDTGVVVVGAGPVGLMLAGELRLAGADTLVLERLAEPTTESRASTLHARTMEVLDSRGLLERLGEVPREPRGHFGGLPLDLTLPGPYPGQWKVPQTRLEELLGAWARELGADVRRGHTVTGLDVTDDGVEVEARDEGGVVRRFRAAYVVGCDGEDSAVRRLGGFAFPGTDPGRRLLRADVAGVDIPDRRFERLPGGIAIAARRPDGVTRVMVHETGAAPGSEQPGFDDVAGAWRRVTGEDIGGGTPLWVNAFHDGSRQVTHYRRGRLLLAGDAAHQQMPVGGQALNMGLQDAVDLGWRLAAEVAGWAPDGLLDSYHAERHAVGRRVLGNIRAQSLLLMGGGEVDAAREVLAELTGHEEVRAHLAGMVAGLDIRHDVGAGTDPLCGRRLPHWRLEGAEGPFTSTSLLRSGRGLLLVPGGADGAADGTAAKTPAALAAGWAERVRTVTASPAGDGEGPHTVLLVRPDGCVVWTGADGTDLATALERWFGEPAGRGGGPAAGHARAAGTVGRAGPARPVRATTTTTTVEMKGRWNMGRLTGRTALVTGASRGMGRATALRLAAEGALVAVHYGRNEDAAREVVASVEKDGGRAFAVRAELGVTGDVHELFLGLEEGLKERTGATDLHILVNNAGVMGGVKPEETTVEQFDELFRVNARAPFFLIQRALRNMPDGGRIVNISSGLTRFANPDEIAYAMTKGAVEQLALHFAKHLGPRGITVNSVAPGITRNGNPVFDIPEAVEQMARLSAFNRVGDPEDVADVVAFLATDDARWITGAFIDATGGTLLG
ncbi:SDR family oxidoreductase [Streptomyces sp. NPDC003444]